MPVTYCKGTNVRQIIQTLPADQICHLSNVGLYVGVLTEKLYGGLYLDLAFSDERRYFGEAAYYHDIGKAWVPHEILVKPDELTIEEALEMRKHSVLAEELFRLITGGAISGMPEHLVRLAHDSAVYHHEWWNGQGYPYSLYRDEIPLIARITSICDVYDAITSDRSYRKARTHDYACREIKANAGTQFDPAIVWSFLENEYDFFALTNQRFSL